MTDAVTTDGAVIGVDLVDLAGAAHAKFLAAGCNTFGLSVAVGDDGNSGLEERTGSGDG